MKLRKMTAEVAAYTLTLLSIVSATSHASSIEGAVNDHIPLGTAYNSLSGEFLNFQTVKGEVAVRGITDTNILSTQNLSYREIASRISGEVTINADFPVVKAEAGADIALATGSDEFSSNWVLSVMNLAKSHVLTGIAGASGLTLSPQGQTIADQNLNDSALLKAAGDEFVTEIEYATQLFVSMKADYLSTSDKKAINGNISVDFALGDVSGDLQFLSEEQKQSVTITVRAHQFGGDPLNLLAVIPNNIVTCNLTNFTPCETLFEEAIKYAKGIDQYNGIGFKDQVADVSNSNIVGYKTEKYQANFGTYALAPANSYSVDDNAAIIDVLESEYVDQLTAQRRASGLLTRSLAYLNTTQRAALRNTTTVSLNNAEALRDLINYCYVNVYNGDCTRYIADECAIENGSRSCIKQYSTKVFELANQGAFKLVQQQYRHLMTPASINDLGLDLLQLPDVSVNSKHAANVDYNKTIGKVSGHEGLVIASKSNTNASFLVKTNKKLTRAALWPQGEIGSFQIRVYQNGQWPVSQDSSFVINQSVINGADAIDGHYYYRYDIKNTAYPIIDMNIWGSNQNVDFYFYQNPIHVTPMTTGLNNDNTPFYFTSRNIMIDKDINGADIGWCATGRTVRRSKTDYCRNNGRLYTWADAAKACEAYSAEHEAKTGLFWSLPTNADIDLFIQNVEQSSGAGNAGYWLKSYQFDLNNGVHNTNNMLGFNMQTTGYVLQNWTQSNARIKSSNLKGFVWLASENSPQLGSSMGFSESSTGVYRWGLAKNGLLGARCIGKYTK